MKKLTAIVLFAALMLSLVSCGGTELPTESAEPSATASPSATPNAEPSAEPSEVPSVVPADDIDAYWEGRTLTSDSGDLMMDAARWVRDYYRSFYASVSPYESRYVTLAAARMTYLRSDGFELYTECYFLSNSGGEKLVDEYAASADDSGYWYLRPVFFDFEAVDGGYRYTGISASATDTVDCAMSTTVVRDGVESAGLENNIWQLETLVGYIANGEVLDTLPSDAEKLGSLSYSYSDTAAEWEFYTYTKVVDEWNSYECVAARSVDTGEAVDTSERPMYFYLDMPSASEMIEYIEQRASEPFMLSMTDGYYYTMPEEVQAIRDALVTAIRQGGFRLSNSVRDSATFLGSGININSMGLVFEHGWENPGVFIQLGISLGESRSYSLLVDTAEGVYTEAKNFMQNKLDTLRDGTFLSDADEWGEPLTPTDESRLLNRAYDLFGIYNMSSIMLSNDDPPEDAVPIIIDSLYYYDMSYLYDPTADGYLAHIASYADFIEYTHSVFCDELADHLIGNGVSYFEGPNGELYGGGFGRGGMNLSVGKTLAYYKFEPAEDILVVRTIHERYTSHDGWQTEEYVGEGAWDTVFVKEDGAWKVKYISYEV